MNVCMLVFGPGRRTHSYLETSKEVGGSYVMAIVFTCGKE